MSKSKGNIFYVDTLLERGYDAAQVRFFLIYGHYLEDLNFSDETMAIASDRLNEFRKRVKAVTRAAGKGHGRGAEAGALRNIFLTAMDNDLNVKKAFDGLDRLLSQIAVRKLSAGDASAIAGALREIDQVFRVIF